MNPLPDKLFRLDGKVALVTGASSGLGLHFAGVLARAGAAVALAARRCDRVADAAAALRQAGGQALAVTLDVTSAGSVRSCFDEVVQALGLPEVVVNNAGISVAKPLLQQEEGDWDQVVDTNLKGNWLVAMEAARRLVAGARGGSIVNIASILGDRVAGGVAPYAISKAGVLQATRAMALELARHGIRVNALVPGYVATDLNRDFLESEAGQRLRARIPGRRFGQPSDLDGPLLLLVSDAGAAVTGAAVTVDHGHSVSSL